MNDRDFAVLCELKDRLVDIEQRYPMNARAKELHKRAWFALCRLRGALNLTEEQFAVLAAPQGGGTPKTHPDEE